MARPKGTPGNAKERIEWEAMRLFATKGYAATTTKDIAEAAGIKDASIYNHFKGKRDLFESVVEGELRHLTKVLRETGAMADPADSSEAYGTLDVALLAPVVLDSFRPLFADERIVCLRHMLEANRYEDERCGELFREIFIERPLAIEEAVFSRLVEAGVFGECDPGVAAAEFYGSAFLLLMADAPWDEASKSIEGHLREFIGLHTRRGV